MPKKFITLIKAEDPKDGMIKTFYGPYIEAETIEQAEEYCQKNNLGYLQVQNECVIAEIETDIDLLFKSFKFKD